MVYTGLYASLCTMLGVHTRVYHHPIPPWIYLPPYTLPVTVLHSWGATCSAGRWSPGLSPV